MIEASPLPFGLSLSKASLAYPAGGRDKGKPFDRLRANAFAGG
jgi:hypothetical protein